MANKIEYTQKKIGNEVTITIIRLVCENECEEANRKQVLEYAANKITEGKTYKIFKDIDNYEYVIIEGENELDFTDITKEVTSC